MVGNQSYRQQYQLFCHQLINFSVKGMSDVTSYTERYSYIERLLILKLKLKINMH